MEIRTVAVTGAGIMGAGIAQSLAMHGYRVHLHDLTDEVLANALDRIENHRFGLRRAVERGKLVADALDGVLDRIATTTDLAAACADIDLAVEAVPESLALKMQVFRRMDELAPRHAILTSNSGGLSITALAYATTRPELVLRVWAPVPVRTKSMASSTVGANLLAPSASGSKKPSRLATASPSRFAAADA